MGERHFTFKPFIPKKLGCKSKSSVPPKSSGHVSFTKYPPDKTYHDSRDTIESVCISELSPADCLIHRPPRTHFFLLGSRRIILHLNMKSIAPELCVMLHSVAWGQQDFSVDVDTCCRGCQPEFDSLGPHGERREPAPTCCLLPPSTHTHTNFNCNYKLRIKCSLSIGPSSRKLLSHLLFSDSGHIDVLTQGDSPEACVAGMEPSKMPFLCLMIY